MAPPLDPGRIPGERRPAPAEGASSCLLSGDFGGGCGARGLILKFGGMNKTVNYETRIVISGVTSGYSLK